MKFNSNVHIFKIESVSLVVGQEHPFLARLVDLRKLGCWDNQEVRLVKVVV